MAAVQGFPIRPDALTLPPTQPIDITAWMKETAVSKSV